MKLLEKHLKNIENKEIRFTGGGIFLPIVGLFLIAIEIIKMTLTVIHQIRTGTVEPFLLIAVILILGNIIYIALNTERVPPRNSESPLAQTEKEE